MIYFELIAFVIQLVLNLKAIKIHSAVNERYANTIPTKRRNVEKSIKMHIWIALIERIELLGI